MQFDRAAELVAGVPYLPLAQGRTLYEQVRKPRPEHVLDLGTAHGVSAAYIAAALDENGVGDIVSVDSRNFITYFTNPTPQELLDRLGLSRLVTLDHASSTYTWFLKRELERHMKDGAIQPHYDFVYLDGQKNWTTDGLAVLLIERLLRENGWLLMDDLAWTYSSWKGDEISSVHLADLSDEELVQPHLRAVFELLVMQHPSFTQFRIEDDWWGWAQKRPGTQRSLHVDVTRSWSSYFVSALRRVLQTIDARGARRRI
jgi:predicted O-methyltransferase YrrM